MGASCFDIQNVRYVILPGKNIPIQMQEYYERAYTMWHSIWFETFQELDGIHSLHSDEFTRQDEITVLISPEAVIGFFAFSWMDLNLRAHREHSYFKTYTPDIINSLRNSYHANIMTMGNLAVLPSWRKSEAGPLISEILLGLATKRFMESEATVLIAFTRNNRKVNDLVYRYGAVPMKEKLIEHNVEVDLILIDKQSIKKSPIEKIPEYVDTLWNQRIDFKELSKNK